MKILKNTVAILALLVIASCKNEPEEGYDPVTNTDIEYSPTESGILRDTAKGTSGRETQSTDQATPPSPSREASSDQRTASLSGKYIKLGEEKDFNCECYCLDINLNSTSEFCLVPNEMYIETRMERSNDNTINVFLVGPSAKNKTNVKVPWDKFDKEVPIASINLIANGEVQMNWLGFTSEGDLAMDYAIYGKKTLEGIYKKK